jgi:hypothetical protein
LRAAQLFLLEGIIRPHARQQAWRWWVIVILLLLLAAALRFYRLDFESLWGDEIGQVSVASQDSLSDVLKGVKQHAAATPLDYLLLHFALKIDDTDAFVRVPAAIYGTLSVLFMYLLSYQLSLEAFRQRTSSYLVGVTSAFLLATSPFHVGYSREARFYALFVLLSLTSVLSFWIALRHASWKWWLIWTAVTLLSAYAHLYTFLLMLCQGLYLIGRWIESLPVGSDGSKAQWHWQQLIRYAMASILVILAVLPWLLWDTKQDIHYNYTFPSITLKFFLSILGAWSNSHLILMYVFGAMALLGLWQAWRAKRRPSLFLALAVILLPLAPILLDFLTGYFFAYRQTLFAMPYYLILIAWGIVTLADWMGGQLSRRRIKLSLGTTVVTCVALLSILAMTVPRLKIPYTVRLKHNWRDIATLVETYGQMDEAVLVDPSWQKSHLLYYYSGDLPILLPRGNVSEIEKAVNTHRGIWLILILSPDMDPRRELRNWSDQQELSPVFQEHQVTVFHYRPELVRIALLNEFSQELVDAPGERIDTPFCGPEDTAQQCYAALTTFAMPNCSQDSDQPTSFSTHPTLFLHPPAQVRYTLRIPDEPVWLRFHVGLDPQSWDWGGDGATFEIWVESEGTGQQLYTHHVDNMSQSRCWHEGRVDLSPHAGRTIDLVLGTSFGPGHNATGDWAGWAMPQIVSP